MKICSHCKQELALVNFSKDKHLKSGLLSRCKNCCKEYSQKYREIHRKELREKWKEYYLANQEKNKKYHKKYYSENPEKVEERNEKWRRANPEKKRKYSKKYRLANLSKISQYWKKYRDSLEGRDLISNRKYGIYVSDLLKWQNYKCAICQERENSKKLHVDHDHITRQMRMLLCNGCNTGNKITDNINLLLAKVEYLETYL